MNQVFIGARRGGYLGRAGSSGASEPHYSEGSYDEPGREAAGQINDTLPPLYR